MQELESALGVRQLERGRRGVTATAHGQALARRATAVFDDLNNALHELDWLSDPEAGEVRIGGGDTQQAGVPSAVARTLLVRHPLLRIHFESAQAKELVELLLPQRLVDLAVIRPAVDPLPAELEVEPLFHEQLLVVSGLDHPLAGRRRH